MNAVDELRREKRLMQFDIRKFMETEDIEELRKLSNSIKERATKIVNLKKEIKGAKEVRREAKKRRR